MIKKLSDTFSYTPQEVKDKINEIIDQANFWMSQEPAIVVVELDEAIQVISDILDKVNLHCTEPFHHEYKLNQFLARKIK